ncbi:MAG: ABC transporter ATP-binding protein [Bacteroidales bacterium]|nr:ABC transporter ATP-binding protein [Bacteroidales bacterium]
MSDIAIQFDNVGKLYKLGLVGTGTLGDDLTRWWKMSVLRQEDPFLKIGESNDRTSKGDSDYVWALQNISFDVHQGDVVGIIGKNGAGKSTLLKLLSRVTTPTTGVIRAHGRIASLLEVGTGFHPELTGRENIYMNGSIMGMRKAEITRKLDEIVDFAGVERYIDTPVKRYSSGMTVRLGFAVAAFLEPEILVVDEVLAVGDAEFQKKAIGKMQDVSKGEGRTVLFVSHNMAAVKSLCHKGIVLENGTISYIGAADSAISKYLLEGNKTERVFDVKNGINYGSSTFVIDEIAINGERPHKLFLDECNNTLDVLIKGSTSLALNVQFILQVYDSNDILVTSYCPGNEGRFDHLEIGNFQLLERIYFPENMTNGNYRIKLEFLQRGIAKLAEIINLMTVAKRDNINEHVGIERTPKNTGYFYLNGYKILE